MKIDPIEALLETADFAASILNQIEAPKRLGGYSLAGQVFEAASRLKATADLVRNSDKRFIEQTTRTRVLAALQLPDTAWQAGSMHAYGALCFVSIPADTISEGLTIIERLNPINGFNSTQYKGTYVPESAQKYPLLEATPYTGHLSGLREYPPDQFELRAFIVTRDGDTIQVRVPVADFKPIYRTYVTRALKGRMVVENTVAHGWPAHFRCQHKMASGPDQPNDFIFAA